MSGQRGSLGSVAGTVVRPTVGDPARLVAVMRALQDLAAKARGDVGEQLADVLRLGCAELDLPTGVLVRVRQGQATVLDAVPRAGPIRPGSSFRAADTYCGAILEAQAPIGFPDEDQAFAPRWPADPVAHLGSYVGVPIRVGGELYGVLSFGSPERRAEPFSREEKQIVEILARHLEGVIGGQEQLDQVVGALNEISSASLPEFFEKLARQTAELLEAEYVLICERVGGDDPRLFTHVYLARGDVAETYDYSLAGTPCERTMNEGSYFCGDGLQEVFPEDAALAPLGARSYLGAAILDGDGRAIGQIAALDSRPAEASPRRERLLRILAGRATAGLLRLRAERELQEQKELFQLASQASRIGVWDVDLEANRLTMDSNAREMLGGDVGDDALETWRAAIHPADRDSVREAVGAHLRGETEGYLVEYRIERADGETRWVLTRGRAIRDASGRAIRTVAAGLDITPQKRLEDERQRLETKVRQAQRLESLGVLAGGLAHDFNNLLMGVLGNAGLARRGVQAGSVVDRQIAEIETAAGRAAELTNQMLAYSGRAKFTADAFDLNDLVEEMARLLRTVVSKKAALSLQLGGEPLPIEADASQVRQVVMNLITNASDALADQPGVVTMATGLRHFDAHDLAEVLPDEDLTAGPYAFLEVADTGVGMDEGTRARIFDPSFTTKFTGRGLGLAAVLGIMRSHGGGIRVQSAPGEGTRAMVLFPPAEADEEMLEDEPGQDDEAWEGQGAVLVVDDEEIVRNLMATVLDDAGFEVLTASDGVEALEVFDANVDRIRLILLDMTMPRMNGEEVYAEIRAKNRDTSIILMSGFSEEHVTRGISGENATFLKKPFEITVLLDAVQNLLDS